MPRKHLNIGSKIQNRRKAMGLSQEDLAQRTGVSRQAVTKWETGQSAPDLDRLVRLCDELGISLDHLLRDDTDLPTVQDELGSMENVPEAGRRGHAEAGHLLSVCGWLLSVAGILGIFVMWILAKIYPVQLTDWEGNRHAGLWGFILRYDLRSLFWLSVGIAFIGILLLFVRHYGACISKRCKKNGCMENGRGR